jgi:menaquinone-dependent protoporphyrinogen oxidase
MAAPVLVAYATRYGSTEEVAHAVGKRLGELGVGADVQRARQVRSVADRKAVVLATPFYFGSMLAEARRFLERNRDSIERSHLAIIALGPISASEELRAARAQLDRVLAAMQWVKPAAAAMFVGKYDPSMLRLRDRLIAALPGSPLHGVPAHDDRDWDAIREWVDELPEPFRRPA